MLAGGISCGTIIEWPHHSPGACCWPHLKNTRRCHSLDHIFLRKLRLESQKLAHFWVLTYKVILSCQVYVSWMFVYYRINLHHGEIGDELSSMCDAQLGGSFFLSLFAYGFRFISDIHEN